MVCFWDDADDRYSPCSLTLAQRPAPVLVLLADGGQLNGDVETVSQPVSLRTWAS
jgi:hypothetical protein